MVIYPILVRGSVDSPHICIIRDILKYKNDNGDNGRFFIKKFDETTFLLLEEA